MNSKDGNDVWGNGLRQFVTRRRSLQESGLSPARLQRLIDTLKPLLAERPPPPAPRAPDPAGLAAALGRLKPELATARAAGLMINPWTAAGLRRNEVRNTSALAALWSPQLGGETAIAFLAAFLARLDAPPGMALPSLDELHAGYVVRTEHSPMGEASERVDITIEGASFLIGIEVKIDAGLGEDQLERYAGSIRARAGSRRAIIIFLAPFKPKLDNVIAASWTDVRTAARAVAQSMLPGFNQQLITNFAAHAARF